MVPRPPLGASHRNLPAATSAWLYYDPDCHIDRAFTAVDGEVEVRARQGVLPASVDTAEPAPEDLPEELDVTFRGIVLEEADGGERVSLDDASWSEVALLWDPTGEYYVTHGRLPTDCVPW